MKTKLFLLTMLISAIAFARGSIMNSQVASISDIRSAVLTTTGNVASGSACIASPASISKLSAGQYVYDTTNPTYIPASTTIVGIGTSPCTAGQIKLSATAGGTATGDTLTFGGQDSQAVNSSKIWLETAIPAQTLASAVTTGAIGGGGGNSGKNYLLNSGFEAGAGSWTIAGASSSVNISDYHEGAQALNISPSGAGSILQSPVPAPNLLGSNLESGAWIKTTKSGVELCALAGGVETLCQAVPASGAWTYVSANQAGPTQGTSIGVKIKWAATGGSIIVDQGYAGLATNLSNISQNFYVGKLTTYNCNAGWSVSTPLAQYNPFAAVTSCSYSASGISSPTTVIPAFKMSGGPGKYKITVNGTIYLSGTSTGNGGTLRFSDGTNVSTVGALIGAGGSVPTSVSASWSFYIDEPSSFSNATFQMQASNVASSNSINIQSSGPQADGSDGSIPLIIEVEKITAQSQLAVTSNTTPSSAALHYDASAVTWSYSASGGFVDSTTNNILAAVVDSNTNMGTCSQSVVGGNSVPGFSCTGFIQGNKYKICAIGQGGPTASITTNIFGLSDGTTTFGQSTNYNGTSTLVPFNQVCGIYTAASSAPTIRIVNSGAASYICTGSLACILSFTVEQVTGGLPAPILVGGVSSSSGGADRIERMKFGGVSNPSVCSSSPCTIYSTSDSLGSITRSSTGVYIWTFGVQFSSAPTCICMANTPSSLGFNCETEGVAATSSAVTMFSTNASNAVLADNLINVICTGPK